MTTTARASTPLYDATVKATGINPKATFAFTIPPMTKRQRHKLAPITEAVLVAAGFGPKEEGTTE